MRSAACLTTSAKYLRLAYFGDYTQTQIAAQLGVPLGTVKARTFRGLRRLGRLLASDHQPAREAVSAGTQGRGHDR